MVPSSDCVLFVSVANFITPLTLDLKWVDRVSLTIHSFPPLQLLAGLGFKLVLLRLLDLGAMQGYNSIPPLSVFHPAFNDSDTAVVLTTECVALSFFDIGGPQTCTHARACLSASDYLHAANGDVGERILH